MSLEDDKPILDDHSLPFVVGELVRVFVLSYLQVCTVLLSLNALINNEVPPNMNDLEGGIRLHDEKERLVLEKREDEEEYQTGSPIKVSLPHFFLC